MATLVSPGVSVTVIDESQYLPATQGSVPLVIVATAQNKADASGTAVAKATTSANAGKLFQVTSQRDLINLYGTPFFYSTSNGTPIHGYELNEYGLLAAYSVLGVTNRCYVLRADIDLAGLVGRTGRPAGDPDNGTLWLDTINSTWGLFEFDATLGEFKNKLPIVITDPAKMSANLPLSSIGNIGDYAVNAIQMLGAPTNASEIFYKTRFNTWVPVGSQAWRRAIPTVKATTGVVALDAYTAESITITLFNGLTKTIQIPATTHLLADAINNLNWEYLHSDVIDGKFSITMSFPEMSSGSSAKYFSLSGTSTAFFNTLGITLPTSGLFYQPGVAYGTSAQMPFWTSSQSAPRPTGSVWVKVNQAGNGMNMVVEKYNADTRTWLRQNVPFAVSDYAASAVIDPTGGAAIPAGSLYAQYWFNGTLSTSPVYLWERIAAGETVITSAIDQPAIVPGAFTVQVSTPGSTVLTSAKTVTVSGVAAADFVTAWVAAGIPHTRIDLTPAGAIQLVHTFGGEIVIIDNAFGTAASAGFAVGVTDGCKYGQGVYTSYVNIATTGGTGSAATINVAAYYTDYYLQGSGVSTAGSGYLVGDVLTVNGSLVGGVSGSNNITLVVASVNGTGGITGVALSGSVPSVAKPKYTVQLSNWRQTTYIANEGRPVKAPANNTPWYYSVIDEVDIMVQKGGAWIGYRQTSYDRTGHPSLTGVNYTDPNGPIIATDAPVTQSDGTGLVYGDLWIDSNDLENYPMIYRWEAVDNVDQWVLIDNTDQIGSKGIVFADARWATSGSISPANDPMSTIPELLVSNNLDLDAPEANLYPQGTLLFNTRRSGFNVKHYRTNYFNSVDFPNGILPTEKSTWVTISGNKSNGSPYMGRKAQRASVVNAMIASVSTNTDIRVDDNYFTLIAAPGYPELQPAMVGLNNERGMTAFIIGDTPMRLDEQATSLANWANNNAGADSTGEEGMVTRDTYLGVYYPSGITTDLTGKPAVVPASHMMLRTFIRSDAVSYPWMAAAGIRRGLIDNATNIGYINKATGEFQTTKVRVGIRDVLYLNQMNPLTFFTGTGLLNYGNKTSFASNSALDRVNVARLINYIRYQLAILARPFVFEPNDSFTRNQVRAVAVTLMTDLMTKRGIYDYLVVCDTSNNTPDRIDRNELWIDVAIEPVKAAEFIYIPVRVMNTGEINANNGR